MLLEKYKHSIQLKLVIIHHSDEMTEMTEEIKFTFGGGTEDAYEDISSGAHFFSHLKKHDVVNLNESIYETVTKEVKIKIHYVLIDGHRYGMYYCVSDHFNHDAILYFLDDKHPGVEIFKYTSYLFVYSIHRVGNISGFIRCADEGHMKIIQLLLQKDNIYDTQLMRNAFTPHTHSSTYDLKGSDTHINECIVNDCVSWYSAGSLSSSFDANKYIKKKYPNAIHLGTNDYTILCDVYQEKQHAFNQIELYRELENVGLCGNTSDLVLQHLLFFYKPLLKKRKICS